MLLGLVPRVQTYDLGWICQEVHHCATHVIVPVVRVFCSYIYRLNDKAVNLTKLGRLIITGKKDRKEFSSSFLLMKAYIEAVKEQKN